MQASLNISAIKNVPDIVPGDRINNIIGDCLEKDIVKLENGDIISIAHKIFSKAEGAIINLRDVVPSQEAENYAKKLEEKLEKKKLREAKQEEVQRRREERHRIKLEKEKQKEPPQLGKRQPSQPQQQQCLSSWK